MDSELSSPWTGNNGEPYPAADAIDGDYDSLLAHTGVVVGGWWWRVNLQNYHGQLLVTVNKVTVWNRRDDAEKMADLVGAVVKFVWGRKQQSSCNLNATHRCFAVQTVDFGEVTGVTSVMVQQDNYEVLFLAEVEGWGKYPSSLSFSKPLTIICTTEP